jgi:hypothetical protein
MAELRLPAGRDGRWAEMPLAARNAKLSMTGLEHTEGKPQGATRPGPGS